MAWNVRTRCQDPRHGQDRAVQARSQSGTARLVPGRTKPPAVRSPVRPREKRRHDKRASVRCEKEVHGWAGQRACPTLHSLCRCDALQPRPLFGDRSSTGPSEEDQPASGGRWCEGARGDSGRGNPGTGLISPYSPFFQTGFSYMKEMCYCERINR